MHLKAVRFLLVCGLLGEGHLAGAEPTGSDPIEHLARLASDARSQVGQLREAYLALQRLRLAGKAPLPSAPGMDQTEKWLRRQQQSAPLTAEETGKLEQWFNAQPAFREKFLLAVDPRDDSFSEAARVALAIREKFPKESEPLMNLVVAFAVVWDNPAVVKNIMVQCVPELYQKPPEPSPYLDSFGWYVKNQKALCPWFQETPWRLLVYVAAEGIALSERDWVLSKYRFTANLGKLYSDVQYDYSKLKNRWGKLEGKPYTLTNVLQYGGVCRDQAFFAREVCRTMGLPAYMATGKGNTTGEGLAASGHAWVGWIVKDARGYSLESHGRYAYHKYFMADIVDPSSGRQIQDYMVGIEARGASNEKAYDEADLYYRVWREVGTRMEAQARAQLLVESLRRNPFHREAWLELGLATAAGDLPQSMAGIQWNYLVTSFKEFPDFTYRMARNFALMFKTAQEKFHFFDTTAKIFSQQKRQDLVADLRLDEVEMCIAEQRKDLALQVAVAGMGECAGEGGRGAALAVKAVALAKELKQERFAISPLKSALARTPQNNAMAWAPDSDTAKANDYWVSMAKSLIELYEAVGDTKNAEQMRLQVERAQPDRR
jgi:hypothetical protein